MGRVRGGLQAQTGSAQSMIAQVPFWQRKRLHEMTPEEWESLCDGCGKCCLNKLEDEDTGEVYHTDLVCRYMDEETCQCTVYEERPLADWHPLRSGDPGSVHEAGVSIRHKVMSE